MIHFFHTRRLYFEAKTKQKWIINAIMLTERYAPSPRWYLSTMTSIIKNYSHFVPLKTGRDIIQLIADGPTGQPGEDMEFRIEAVKKMMDILMEGSRMDDVGYRVSPIDYLIIELNQSGSTLGCGLLWDSSKERCRLQSRGRLGRTHGWNLQ